MSRLLLLLAALLVAPCTLTWADTTNSSDSFSSNTGTAAGSVSDSGSDLTSSSGSSSRHSSSSSVPNFIPSSLSSSPSSVSWNSSSVSSTAHPDPTPTPRSGSGSGSGTSTGPGGSGSSLCSLPPQRSSCAACTRTAELGCSWCQETSKCWSGKSDTKCTDFGWRSTLASCSDPPFQPFLTNADHIIANVTNTHHIYQMTIEDIHPHSQFAYIQINNSLASVEFSLKLKTASGTIQSWKSVRTSSYSYVVIRPGVTGSACAAVAAATPASSNHQVNNDAPHAHTMSYRTLVPGLYPPQAPVASTSHQHVMSMSALQLPLFSASQQAQPQPQHHMHTQQEQLQQSKTCNFYVEVTATGLTNNETLVFEITILRGNVTKFGLYGSSLTNNEELVIGVEHTWGDGGIDIQIFPSNVSSLDLNMYRAYEREMQSPITARGTTYPDMMTVASTASSGLYVISVLPTHISPSIKEFDFAIRSDSDTLPRISGFGFTSFGIFAGIAIAGFCVASIVVMIAKHRRRRFLSSMAATGTTRGGFHGGPPVVHGVTPEEMELIPIRPYQKQTDTTDEELLCSVCLSSYEPSQPTRVLACDHRFHDTCITPWLSEHRTCPNCRHDAIPDKVAVADGLSVAVLHGLSRPASPVSSASLRQVAPQRTTTSEAPTTPAPAAVPASASAPAPAPAAAPAPSLPHHAVALSITSTEFSSHDAYGAKHSRSSSRNTTS